MLIFDLKDFFLSVCVFFQGCHDVLEAVLKKNIQWVIVAALVIAFLQVRGNCT